MGRPREFDREEALGNAARAFWKRGYAGTSMSVLEEAMGLNKSSIYHAFADKDALFVASLQHYVEKIAVIDRLSRPPLGWPNIQKFFDLLLECRDEKGCFGGNTLRESAIVPEEANRVVKDYFASMKTMLKANLRAAGVDDPSGSADLMLTFAIGLSFEQNITSSKRLKSKIREFFDVIRSGRGTRKQG